MEINLLLKKNDKTLKVAMVHHITCIQLDRLYDQQELYHQILSEGSVECPLNPNFLSNDILLSSILSII